MEFHSKQSLTQSTEQHEDLELLLKDISFSSRFKIDQVIGAGAHSIVYKAFDKDLNESVTLKVFRPQSSELWMNTEKFLNQVRLSRKITHPRILYTLDFGKVGPVRYLTSPWIEAKSLREILIEEKKLPLQKILDILKQTIEILKTVHGLGFVHRDIKPENILLSSHGEVYLIDFEIAAITSSESALKEIYSGTLPYMPPEQKKGAGFHPSVDIFAWGIIAIECLSGLSPLVIRKKIDENTLKSVLQKTRISSSFKKSLENILSSQANQRPSAKEIEHKLTQIIQKMSERRKKIRRTVLISLLLATILIQTAFYLQKNMFTPKITASSSRDPAHSPNMVIDGNPLTSWISSEEASIKTQKLWVDLGRSKKIESVQFLWGRSYPKHITLSISEDAKTWRVISQNSLSRGSFSWISFPVHQAHYWKIAMTNPVEKPFLELHELKFLNRNPIQASSTEKPGTEPSNASDGDLQTRWSSAHQNNEWLRIDFQKKIPFSWITIDWEDAYPKTYILEISDNGKTWERIYTIGKADGGPDLVWLKERQARYLRLFCLERSTYFGNSLWEISVWDRPCVLASSIESPTFRPEYAIDGDLSTRWSSKFMDRQWLVLDFQKPVTFNQLHLLWEQASAQSYEILASMDRKNWKRIYKNEASAGAEEWLSFEPCTARFVKILCLQRSTSFGFSIYEVSLTYKRNPDSPNERWSNLN